MSGYVFFIYYFILKRGFHNLFVRALRHKLNSSKDIKILQGCLIFHNQ